MSWTSDILRRLFSSKKEEVSWKEKYDFNGDLRSYEEKDYKAFAGLISEQEMWFIHQYAMVSLNTPQSQGVVLKSDKKDDYDFFVHFMEFFRNELVEPKMYYTPVKEKKRVESPDSWEETIFVYLKPKPQPSTDGIKHDQKYGQISLSLINTNEDSNSFKIQVNYYSGFQYTEPIHLKELLEFISNK